MKIQEGIDHLDDLPLDKFISIINNLSNLTGLEKVDGAQLWVGVDDDGKLYTSREGKRSASSRFFSASDWPDVSDFNQFKAAHQALEKIEPELKEIIFPGATVEIEVLFGEQPNTVKYSSDESYLVILRGVAGTPDSVADDLAKKLNGKVIDVDVEIMTSDDGTELRKTSVTSKFKVVPPQKIELAKLKTKKVTAEFNKLLKFLETPSSVSGMSVKELASVSLNTIPKEKREEVKQARENLIAKIDTEFKQVIKKELLGAAAGLKSGISGQNELEGIVIKDPDTLDQIKLVDKDEFLTVNKFNQSARDFIRSPLMTTDMNAPFESRGGLTGELRIRIAKFLGDVELAKASYLKKKIQELKADSYADTLENLADYLNVSDFQQAKRKILFMIAATKKQLDAKLAEFKDSKDTAEITLDSGKVVKMSDSAFKRTLAIFAETRGSFIDQFEKVKKTKDLPNLLNLLYGRIIKDSVSFSVNEAVKRKSIAKGEVDLGNIVDQSDFMVFNSYMSTMFVSILLLKLKDVKTRRILRDAKNLHLRKWSLDMSPLNHWGYVIWKHNTKDAKGVLSKDAYKSVARMTKNIPYRWWKYMHRDLSLDGQVTIDWANVGRTLSQLINFSGFKNKRLNTLLSNSLNWENLSHDEQVKHIGQLYVYAFYFIPRSVLLIRLRAHNVDVIMNKHIDLPLLAEILKIQEDEGGGDAVATASADIASVPMQLFGKKGGIIKRIRNPEIKKMSFKFRKPKND